MSANGDTPEANGATADDVLSANADFDTGLRAGLAYALGQTGFNAPDDDEDPRRNLFETFGWPRSDLDGWTDENWVALYLRSGYAQTVNDKPAEGTWQDSPEVEDTPDSEEQSDFEKAIERADKNLNLWNYCYRADKVAGIGQHGLLLIGYSDIANAENPREQWAEPVEDGEFNGLDDVDSLKPILETQIDEIDWGGPEDGERWGKPLYYSIDFDEDVDDETEDEQTYRRVHWSRVINVPAQEPLDDETLARPRTEPVLNNILDIEKARGAAAEAAFMSANSDLLLNSDPTEVDFSQGADELRDELVRFFEGQPFLRVQGMDVEQLDGDIQDPSGIVEVNLDEISAVTGIPKTELRGNQSGDVSGSEKDERSWHEEIEQRRENYNTPWLVRSIVDRWVRLGILPDPQGGMYEVNWPDPKQLSEADEAGIQKTRSAVLANLAQVAPGVARRAAEGEYIEEGAMPSDVDMDAEPMPQPDPEEMQAQFDRSMGVKANEDIDRTPPEQAQENAQAVLDIREKTDAMTDTGWKRANQLADGGKLSEDVIQRMAQFKRHQSNTEFENFSDVPDSRKGEDAENPWWEDKGTVAWFGWGGTAGVEWAVEQSEKLTDNATRYSEGDIVMTPQGIGVVSAVWQSTWETDGKTVEASTSSPTYTVALKDERVGFEHYKASQLDERDEIETDVDDPIEDIAQKEQRANSKRGILQQLTAPLRANDWTPPESWQESETPARVIALDAWASMGGQFNCRGGGCCNGTMRSAGLSEQASDEFCASFKDYILGTEAWRGWGPD